MKVIIEGGAKEIVALVLVTQGWQFRKNATVKKTRKKRLVQVYKNGRIQLEQREC